MLQLLVESVPEKWIKIYTYAEYSEGYKKVFFYYYPKSQDKPVYSLDITSKFTVSEEEFDEWDDKLYELFSELWEEFKLQGQEQWTNLTFILDNTGKMKIDYGYEDLSERGPVQTQKEWENKYLI